MLAVSHAVDWECMHKHKVAAMHESNVKENKFYIPYTHKVGEPTLIKGEQCEKFGLQVHLGLHKTLEVKIMTLW